MFTVLIMCTFACSYISKEKLLLPLQTATQFASHHLNISLLSWLHSVLFLILLIMLKRITHIINWCPYIVLITTLKIVLLFNLEKKSEFFFAIAVFPLGFTTKFLLWVLTEIQISHKALVVLQTAVFSGTLTLWLEISIWNF